MRRETGDEHEEEEPIECDAESHELAGLLLAIFLEELKNPQQLQKLDELAQAAKPEHAHDLVELDTVGSVSFISGHHVFKR